MHWVRAAALEATGSDGVAAYSNYSFADSSLRTSLFGSDSERLLEVKKRYDKDNMLRRNHNISASKEGTTHSAD
ncbi:Berberine and berberine like protein [compost metagenome]